EQGVPPYWPWVDALRTMPGRSLADGTLRALGRRLAGDLDGRPTASAPLPTEQQRFRLYEEVTQALARCALARPIVLAYDDLQWSDIASNALLRYVTIHLPPSPLLVLAAARDDELPPPHPFLRTIDELGRRRLLRRISVRPLERDASASLLAALLPAAPAPELVDAVEDRCGGNPFCIEESIAALLEGDGQPLDDAATAAWTGTLPLPRGVAAITLRRLERLDASGQLLLATAALTGRVFSADIVAAAAAMSRDAADDLFAEAARRGLLRAADDIDIGADFCFPHDRVREAIAAAIDPGRRRRLHARIAAALEADGRLDEFSRLAALGHHRRQARQFEAAAAAAIRLGDCAMRAHAHREAARAYRTALDLLPDCAPLVGGVARADALLRLGDAALAAADPGAVDALRAAEAAALAAGDERAVAGARRRLGAAFARREEFAPAVACLESGRALLERSIDAAGDGQADLDIELADVLIELAEIEGISLGRYDAAIAGGGRALALAERHAAARPAHAARARLAQANTLMRSGDLTSGRALLPPALAGALAAGDCTLASAVCGAEANVRYWLGDLDASERATARRSDLARRSGDPWALRHAASWQALLDCSRGRWAAAEQALAEAERFVDRLESSEPRAFLQKIRGFSLLLRGRHAEATALLEAAMAGFRASGPGTLVWYLGCLAAAYAASGDAA
ncbi:MAG TPA: AAA family ATPase, partial [Thermomicrobiales bacterium]|nr:AAA family ATPase [Thermomicrobiales bacterium]